MVWFWKIFTAFAIYGAANIGFKWLPLMWSEDPIASLLFGGALLCLIIEWFGQILEPVDARN